MPRIQSSSPFLVGTCAVLGAALLGACGGGHSDATRTSAKTLVSAPVCKANKAAGTITYITGFQYQADVGILDVLQAQKTGLYAAQCLHVVVRSGTGDPGQTASLIDSGRATMGEFGSPSDVMTVDSHGQKIVGIATYGNVTSNTLLTSPSITNLKQLQGKTIGYKGAMPPQITAMLLKAGVKLSTVEQVGVGYNPDILPRGQVQGLTAYKSNEPIELKDQGYEFREWDPDAFGIKASFNVIGTTKSFLTRYTSAAASFMKATFKAYQECLSDPGPCIDTEAALSGPGYNKHQSLQEWKVQTQEVASSMLPGKGLGAETVAQWTPEAKRLLQFKVVSSAPAVSTMIDPSVVDSIEPHGKPVWP